jgi:hypothetical protein
LASLLKVNSMPRLVRAATVLLTPINDPESLLIAKIAAGLRLPTVRSLQPHGARLEHEDNLVSRLRAAGPLATHVAIVEIPGPEAEARLGALGWQVAIIDHHTYENLDRRSGQSSLQQFLNIFSVTDDELRLLGLDPRIVHGVGVVDQGFLWALPGAGFSAAEAVRVRAAYLRLKEEVDPHFSQVHAAAARAWQTHQVIPAEKPIVIVTGQDDTLHIREAVSFLIADAFAATPPWSIIREGNGQISVQDVPPGVTEKLFATYGGYIFGSGVCWGKVPGDSPTPDQATILALLGVSS